ETLCYPRSDPSRLLGSRVQRRRGMQQSHTRFLHYAEPHGGRAHRRYSKRRNGVSEEIQRRLPCRVRQIFPILKDRPAGADRAIAALRRLLSIPHASPLAANVRLPPALLRLDPMFDPLRNDPHFKKSSEKPTSQ